MEYKYGMRLRGFSPLCQPMKGLLRRDDDSTGKYHDILVYDRELSNREMDDYELDYIREGKEMTKKELECLLMGLIYEAQEAGVMPSEEEGAVEFLHELAIGNLWIEKEDIYNWLYG